MPRSRTASLLAFAAILAGCGSSDESAPTTPSSNAPVSSAPSTSGQLRVGATGSGIGDAVTGNSGGVQTLPSTPVPGLPNTETGVGAGASCDDANLLPTEDNLGIIQTATLCLLNGERTDAGLRNLKENPELAEAALKQSKAMVEQQFFDHIGKDGSDPVSRIRSAGYIPSVGTWTVGENLAWGSGALSTPKAIVAAWMKSQGHRENILRSTYKEIGFGIVSGNPRSRGSSGATFTTTFGAVKKAKARRARTSRRARTANFKANASSPRGG